jgi:photosystem II stability/assembly factor-like uncharacterized protein
VLLLFFLAVWLPQQSTTSASLRGLKAVKATTAWASGTKGTYLITTDAGHTWRAATVPGAEALDFRGVEALDAKTAWLMSSGEGDKSRVYRTSDGGKTWSAPFTNPDPKGFWDCIRFWDSTHGILLGDPVEGQFTIFTTADAGQTWQRQSLPPALAGEGAFAASNTSLALRGKSEVWFGTGSPSGARVFHSRDAGKTWRVATTHMSGIFSLVFLDSRNGVAVGGDYKTPKETAHNIAITNDGGITWTEPASHPTGYRSSLAFDGKLLIATGTTGTDISRDKGNTWTPLDTTNYNAVAFTSKGQGYAAGPNGQIAIWKPGR